MNSPGALIGPVNLGNPQEYTILELAEETRKLTRSSSEIIFKPLPSDDPTQRKPDITLAREHLKWHPMIPLKVGLQKTIDYFDDLLSHGIDRNETYFMLRYEKLAN
jgi:UDP-glucuronate decarboxylase